MKAGESVSAGNNWTFGIVLVVIILVLLFLVFLESQGIQSLSYIMGS